MNRNIITFTANEQELIKTGGIGRYSTQKVSYIEAHFDLGDNWSGYDAIQAIWFNDHTGVATVLDHAGVCIVPHEVLVKRGPVKVNLVGSISENGVLTDRLTSYPVTAFVVDADARVDSDDPEPVTPSQFDQFVAIVRNDSHRADPVMGSAL